MVTTINFALELLLWCKVNRYLLLLCF